GNRSHTDRGVPIPHPPDVDLDEIQQALLLRGRKLRRANTRERQEIVVAERGGLDASVHPLHAQHTLSRFGYGHFTLVRSQAAREVEPTLFFVGEHACARVLASIGACWL